MRKQLTREDTVDLKTCTILGTLFLKKKKKVLNYNKIRFKWSVQLQGLETYVSFTSSGLENSRQESYQGELFD